uniref:Uncharacterized protein n=1 Tax=Panagrolaimus sp. PS1159 TaxID=55785 RepID=A0AC35EUM7_9BILA
MSQFKASQRLFNPDKAINSDMGIIVEGLINYCLVGSAVLFIQIIGLALYLLYLNYIVKAPENEEEKAAIEKDEEEEFVSEAEDDDDDEQIEEEPKQK